MRWSTNTILPRTSSSGAAFSASTLSNATISPVTPSGPVEAAIAQRGNDHALRKGATISALSCPRDPDRHVERFDPDIGEAHRGQLPDRPVAGAGLGLGPGQPLVRLRSSVPRRCPRHNDRRPSRRLAGRRPLGRPAAKHATCAASGAAVASSAAARRERTMDEVASRAMKPCHRRLSKISHQISNSSIKTAAVGRLAAARTGRGGAESSIAANCACGRRCRTRCASALPTALPAHPGEEIGIIVAPAAQRLDRRHHLGGAIGIMLVQPGAEQRRHFERQSDRKEGRAARAGLGRGLDQRFQLMVGDLRNDRGDRDKGRDAGLAQRLDRRQPLARAQARAAPTSCATLGSSEVTEIATAAIPSFAAGPMMSRSRITRSDLVVMVKGCRVSSSSSRIERVIRQCSSIG